MNKLPKAWKWIIGAWTAILVATLSFYYFADWRYPVPIDSETIIQITSWSAFYGTSYDLAIYGDGTVVYEGKMYVGTVGVRKDKIEVEKVKKLAEEIEEAGFFTLDDQPVGKIYDGGGTVFNIKLDGKERSIGYRFGELNEDTATTLSIIQDNIEETANSRRWVDCKFKSRGLCGFSPIALIAGASSFGLALWIVWELAQRRKTSLGIALGIGIIFLHGIIAWYGNWSFPTTGLSILLVMFELMAILPVSLILIRWQKRKTKMLHSET